MKVVQLSTYDQASGAAAAAYRLYKGLQEKGVDSNMYVYKKDRKESSITSFKSDKSFLNRIRKRIEQIQINRDKRKYLSNLPDMSFFSHDRTPIHDTVVSNLPDADIYHLHRTNNFVDISKFTSRITNKPLVLTLHDVNYFTGGCDYSFECKKFKYGCSFCPQIKNSGKKDLSYQIFQRKLNAYKELDSSKVFIAAPSDWMRDMARESLMFKGFKIETVHNGVDTEKYRPLKKSNVKQSLGIPEDSIVVLFIAGNLNDPRKGLNYLVDALNSLEEKYSNLHLMTIGGGKPGMEMNLPHISMGPIKNENLMNLIINGADIFSIPSIAENCPFTLLESLSCGVPSVGFKTGGIPELIEDGETGFVTNSNTSKDLAEALEKIISDKDLQIKMTKLSRQRVLDEFSIEIYTENFLKIYNDLI